MPTTYDPCPDEVADLANEIITAIHPRLDEAGVSIEYLFAVNETGPALKLHGYPSAAQVKINSYTNRVGGMKDVTIKIDKATWDEADEDERRMILDHELTHLEPQKDKRGNLKEDNAGRPKFKMRLHDLVAGEFYEIIKRHGRRAYGARAVAEAQKKFVQLGLFSGDDMRPDPEGNDQGITTTLSTTINGETKSVTLKPGDIEKAAKKLRKKHSDPFAEEVRTALEDAGIDVVDGPVL